MVGGMKTREKVSETISRHGGGGQLSLSAFLSLRLLIDEGAVLTLNSPLVAW